MYNDQFSRLEAFFKEVLARLDVMERKLQELLEDDYYEDDERPVSRRNESKENRFIDEDEIYKLGQKIPYNRITNENDMEGFREFVSYVRMHEDRFSAKEVDYSGFADKNFRDIRLSDNSRRILGQAYIKAYGKQWTFNFERGFMYKLHGQISWMWANGEKD